MVRTVNKRSKSSGSRQEETIYVDLNTVLENVDRLDPKTLGHALTKSQQVSTCLSDAVAKRLIDLNEAPKIMKVKLEKTITESLKKDQVVLEKDKEIAHLKEEMGKLKQESVANQDGWKEAHEKLKSLNLELDNIQQANKVIKSELDLSNAKLEKVPVQIQQAIAEYKKSPEFAGEMDVVMTEALMIGYTRAADLARSLKPDLEADRFDANYYDPDAESAYEQFMSEFQEGVNLQAKYRGAAPTEETTAANSFDVIPNSAPDS